MIHGEQYIPRPVRRYISLISVDARKSSAEIERVFGVKSLQVSDIELRVNADASELKDWTALAAGHLLMARHHLYAFRLSQTADHEGRDLRRLRDAKLVVCERIVAEATYMGKRLDPVVVTDERDGFVVGSDLYLVSKKGSYPQGDQVFWRAVANLLADLLGTGVAAEFASLLTCATPAEMSELLNVMTEERATKLLEKARRALDSPEDEDIEDDTLRLPTPVEPEPQSLPSDVEEPDIESSERTDSSISSLSEIGSENEEIAEGKRTFQPTQAPDSSRQKRREFVVGGASPNRGHSIGSPAGEPETLSLVEKFESQDSRFPVRVSHLKGYEGPKCDIISFSTEEAARRATVEGETKISAIDRFIEVKGRNRRTGAVELTENELLGAKKYQKKFFIYRVFCDPADDNKRELAILQDPCNSPAMVVIQTANFDLSRESGAVWFELKAVLRKN